MPFMKINRSPLKRKQELPVIVLPDTVIFPYTVAPFFLTDKISVAAIDLAMKGKRDIFLAFQKESTESNLSRKHLYNYGTVAHILQVLKLPDGNSRILVEGRSRGLVQKLTKKNGILMLQYKPLPDKREVGREMAVTMETLQESFKDFAAKIKRSPGKSEIRRIRLRPQKSSAASLLPSLQFPQRKK